MSVRISKKMDVILTLCVPTLKDPTFAAVFEAMKDTARTAQVGLVYYFILSTFGAHSLIAFCQLRSFQKKIRRNYHFFFGLLLRSA